MIVCQVHVAHTHAYTHTHTHTHTQSPLHLAVLTRQHKVIQYLLKANANPLVCDREGNTPLHLAVEWASCREPWLCLIGAITSTLRVVVSQRSTSGTPVVSHFTLTVLYTVYVHVHGLCTDLYCICILLSFWPSNPISLTCRLFSNQLYKPVCIVW